MNDVVDKMTDFFKIRHFNGLKSNHVGLKVSIFSTIRDMYCAIETCIVLYTRTFRSETRLALVMYSLNILRQEL